MFVYVWNHWWLSQGFGLLCCSVHCVYVCYAAQVLSGANTYMWDPSGHHLAQTAAEIRTPAPRARMYKHTESDLTERFADQYVPWDFIPDFSNDTLSTPLTCTAIRLPLRGPAEISSGSVISQDPVDVGLIKQELVKFCPLAGQSLLLTAHLTKAVVQVWEADADEPVTVWKCEAATASSSSTAVRPGKLHSVCTAMCIHFWCLMCGV